jgi:predicted RNA-binding protein with TRAM domain
MAKDSDLKVIFYEPGSEHKDGAIIADGYFSFVPTFKEGDTINITRSKKSEKNNAVNNPISHKTHRVLSTDWVVMVNDVTKDALATLIVSVSKLEPATIPSDFPSIVGTHE